MDVADVARMEAFVESTYGPVKPRRPRVPGYVYFIQANGGPIKIGWSADPAARLRKMQTAHPYRLRLLACVRSRRKLERELHREFADDRLQGEWFRDSAALMARIANLSPERTT